MKARQFFCLLLVPLLLTGCVTPEKRAQENPAAFGKLKASDKQLVLKGQISQGMSPEAVYIALGRASRKEVNRNVEIWTYIRVVSREIPRWCNRYYYRHDGGAYSVPTYDPITVYDSIPWLQVTFTDGKVTGWKEL